MDLENIWAPRKKNFSSTKILENFKKYFLNKFLSFRNFLKNYRRRRSKLRTPVDYDRGYPTVPTIDLENIWDPRNIFFSSKFFIDFEIYIFFWKNAYQTSYLVYRLGSKTSTVEHDVGYPTVTAIELENI